jgi:hypothetical protein
MGFEVSMMKLKLYKCEQRGCEEHFAAVREPSVCPYCESISFADKSKEYEVISYKDIERARRGKSN